MVRFTLSKNERLSSLKEIDALFSKGKSFTKYPLRIVWGAGRKPDDIPARILFSVSKKKFSRAVDRNRIKRLMRESYRILKPGFFNALDKNHSIDVAIIYIGTELMDLAAIQKSMETALQRLSSQSVSH